jgi:hypothetical protein
MRRLAPQVALKTMIRLGACRALGFARACSSSRPKPIPARNCFDRGRALMEEGCFGEACPLFAESQRSPGGGTLINPAVPRKRGSFRNGACRVRDALSIAIKDGRTSPSHGRGTHRGARRRIRGCLSR